MLTDRGPREHLWYPTDFGRAEVCCHCYLVVSRAVFRGNDFPCECVDLKCPTTDVGAHRLDYHNHVGGDPVCVYCGTRFPTQGETT